MWFSCAFLFPSCLPSFSLTHSLFPRKDYTLIDHLAHFDRERIPERVVHAKGAGAFGYFEVGRWCWGWVLVLLPLGVLLLLVLAVVLVLVGEGCLFVDAVSSPCAVACYQFRGETYVAP